MKKNASLPRWMTDYCGMAAVLVILLAIFGSSARNFFSPATFRMIASQIPDITILAVGMTLVLIIGGIDLSVGSVMALCGAVLGKSLVAWGVPLPLAIGACLLGGLVCGALNGLAVITWKLPAFIVTLGMLEIARGATFLVTDYRTIDTGTTLEFITETSFVGIPLPFVIAILIVALGQLVLSKSIFGRYLVAIGTNEEAVRLSGIDTRPIKVGVFALCGFLAGLAAVIQTARISSANPNVGVGWELQAIAAVVIGGTSLMGGRGSVIGSFFGVLIIAILSTGLDQIGAEEYVKRIITGSAIVAAVVLDYYRNRLSNNKN
ncbi:MAG: ABC transporter permease [Sedimentisphaerales bacterium]|nr:ABC transporter permease [Sedimentisphaerales bacterium]